MKPSPTRPWVNAFADLMELKLGENRHKGDRNGWRAEPVSSLRRMLLQEVAELFYELDTNGVPGTAGDRKRRIQREAADASNILMMIADVAGGMKPKEREVLRLRAALRPAIRIAEAAIEIADNLGEPATNQRQALDEMRIALAESEKEWPE